MNSVLPLINRGVISYWLETKPSEPSMLIVGSDGNISYQDIPVTQWGSISGSIEDQEDLTLVLGALDSTKVNKAGDTMTGNLSVEPVWNSAPDSFTALNVNATNTASTGSVLAKLALASEAKFAVDLSNNLFVGSLVNQALTGVNGAFTGGVTVMNDGDADIRLFEYKDSSTGPFLRFGKSRKSYALTSGTSGLPSNGYELGKIEFAGWNGVSVFQPSARIYVTANGSWTTTSSPSQLFFQATATNSTTATTILRLDGDGTIALGDTAFISTYAYPLELRSGGTKQRFNLYGTYTDSLNYRRLYVDSTTGGAFTIGVEGAGTGASGNTLAISTTTITTNPGYSNSQAFGPGHSMVGTGTTLVGTSVNQSYVGNTVGIGYNVNAVGSNSVYIGNNNTAPTPGSVVASTVSIGNATTSSSSCVVIGASASGSTDSVVLGRAASDADGGIAIGRSVVGTGSQPVAIGHSATATVRGIAIGYFANAGTRSVAIGQNTSAFQDSIAIGNTAVTTVAGQLHFGSSAAPISTMSFPGASFSRINLGDATSANPAIKRNGTAINFRLADDSADAAITAGAITAPSLTRSGGTLALTGGGNTLTVGGTAGQDTVLATGQSFTLTFGEYSGFDFYSGIYRVGGFQGYSVGRTFFLGNTSDRVYLTNDSSNTLAIRNSTNANRINLYGTYTDASNYRRLYVGSTTGGAFTLGVEGLGTGASGNTLTVANATSFSSHITLGSEQRIYLMSDYYIRAATRTGGKRSPLIISIPYNGGDAEDRIDICRVQEGGTPTAVEFINGVGYIYNIGIARLSSNGNFYVGGANFSGLGNVSNAYIANLFGYYEVRLGNSSNYTQPVKFDWFNNLATFGLPVLMSSTLTLGTSGTLVGGTNLVEQRNGANAQTWRLYGTYTDSSNYRRLYISSTTGGSFTLGVQGLGTGASGNTLTISSNTLTNTGIATFSNTGYPNGAVTIKQSDGSNVLQGTVSQGIEFKSGWSGAVTAGIGLNNDDSLQIRHNSNGTILIASTVVLKPSVGFAAKVQTSGGLAVRNNDDNGDAPITAGAITASGTVSGPTGSFANSVYGYIVSANASRCLMFNHFNVANGYGYTFSPNSTAANGSEEFGWYRDGSHTVCLMGGANAERFNLYGTRTDASNYRRLFISSTTAGAFTIDVEGLGTGASGNTLAINTTTITTSPGYSNSQAFGPGHSMVGTGVTLIGTSINQSYSSSTVGIGYNLNAAGRNSVYIGNSNTAPTPGSVVSQVVSIGDQVTTGTVCVAIGSLSSASTNSIAIGYQATDADGGVVIGKSATGTGGQPVVVGNSAYAAGRGVAIGRFASCGHRSIAIGDTATTTADGQLHIGSSQSAISIVSFPGASFSRINLGDATSANPAIKRNGTAINFRLADDSADAAITAGAITASGVITANNTLDFGSGTAGSGRINMTAQQYTPSNVAINMPWGTGAPGGIYGSNGLVGFASASTSYFEVNTSGLRLAGTRSVGLGGTIASPETFLFSGGANTLEQRNSTSAQVWRLYGTYTDSSNYRRLYVSSTTGGAFTLGVEGLGTGVNGNSLQINFGTVTDGSVALLGVSNILEVMRYDSVNRASINASDFTAINNLSGESTTYSQGGISCFGVSSPFTIYHWEGQPISLVSNATGVTLSDTNNSFQPYEGTTADLGTSADKWKDFYLTGNITYSDITILRNAAGQLDIRADNGLRIRNTGNTGNTTLTVGAITASGTLVLRNGNNATRLDLHGTYTDVSNYRRLYVSSTTGGAFTLGVEGAGTGASGNTLTIANALSISGTVELAASQRLQWFNRSRIISWNDGNITLYNSGESDFFNLHFGGTGAAYPCIQRSGTALKFRLADDSGDAPITASTGTFSGALSATSGTFSSNVTGSIIGANSGSYFRLIRASGAGARFACLVDYTCQIFRDDGAQNGIFMNLSDPPNNFLRLGAGMLLAWGDTAVGSGTPHSTGATGLAIMAEANNVLAQRNSTNAQTLRLYGTYTDASNYRRLYVSSTTGGAFTLGVQGLGTGAIGNTLTILSNSTLAFNVNGAERITVDTSGNVGIGQTSPSVGLVIRRSGTDLPALRLEDGDITVPFTSLPINPALNANTIGGWSSSASVSGGCAFSGWTNNTAAAYPLMFVGYHGSTSPTKPAVGFCGFKSNGGSDATTLASSELIAGFFNGSAAGSPVVTIAASGAIAASELTLSGILTHGIQSLASDPTTSDIPADRVRVVKNTTSGELRLWANDGGVMKSVLLS